MLLDISSRMLKVAFLSFKISKFSGGTFPQNPLQVSVSGACLIVPPIQNTLRRPCAMGNYSNSEVMYKVHHYPFQQKILSVLITSITITGFWLYQIIAK